MGSLTSSVPGLGAGRDTEPVRIDGQRAEHTGAANASGPAAPDAPAEDDAALVPVFLMNGVRTSAGPGPGPMRLPAAEASALIRDKLAVGGDRPPATASHFPADWHKGP